MTDWIEGYKLGFKEGVIALKTQLEERADRSIMNSDGEIVYLDYNFVTVSDIDEICKELVASNA